MNGKQRINVRVALWKPIWVERRFPGGQAARGLVVRRPQRRVAIDEARKTVPVDVRGAAYPIPRCPCAAPMAPGQATALDDRASMDGIDPPAFETSPTLGAVEQRNYNDDKNCDDIVE